MKRALSIFALACGISLFSAPAGAVLVAEGTMSVSEENFVLDPSDGTTAWEDALLTWSVSFDDVQMLYTYSYTFETNAEGGAADISHLTVEVSENFSTLSSTCSFSGDLSTCDPEKDGSSPDGEDGEPGEHIFGIIEQIDGASATLIITTDVIPIWGDFFAKDGTVDGWNSGYFAPDPSHLNCLVTTANVGGCGFGFLAVPDSDILPGPSIPEPSTLGLFGIGLAGLGILSRRRRKLFDAV